MKTQRCTQTIANLRYLLRLEEERRVALADMIKKKESG
jgi:hypothetical protein